MPTIEGATGAPYQHAGVPTNGTSEVQTITVTGSPSGGSFRLRFQGFCTASLAYNVSGANLQAALEALASVGSGGCSVSGDGPYVVTFSGNLAKLELEAIVLHANALTAGSNPSITIERTTPGVTASERGAATGATLIDTTNSKLYQNDGTPNEPEWNSVGDVTQGELDESLRTLLFDTAGNPLGGGSVSAPSGEILFGNAEGDGVTSDAGLTRESVVAALISTGDELVSNGGFDGNADGWNLGSNVSYGEGTITSTYDGEGDPSFGQAVNLPGGGRYVLEFDLTVNTEGAEMTVQGATGSTGYGTGHHRIVFDSNEGLPGLAFDDKNYVSGDSWTLDNVSLKKVNVLGPTEIRGDLTVTGEINPPTLGEELLTNPNFNGNADGWTLGSNATYGSNAVSVDMTSSQDDGSIIQHVALEAGKRYRLTFTVSAIANDDFEMNTILSLEGGVPAVVTDAGLFRTEYGSDGTYSIDLNAWSSGSVRIQADTHNYNAGAAFTLESVSLKEITAGATIPMLQPLEDVTDGNAVVFVGPTGRAVRDAGGPPVVQDPDTGAVTLPGDLTLGGDLIAPNVQLLPLSEPSTPTVSVQGTASSTVYHYQIVAKNAVGTTNAGKFSTTTDGPDNDTLATAGVSGAGTADADLDDTEDWALSDFTTTSSGTGGVLSIHIDRPGAATAVGVTTPGTGYTAGDTFTFDHPFNITGSTLTVTITGVTDGGITAFTAALSGANLTTPDSTTSVNGSGATFHVEWAEGAYTVTVTAPGKNYLPGETLTFVGWHLAGSSPANDLVITVNAVADQLGETNFNRVAWSEVTGASGYDLYRQRDEETTWTKIASDLDALTLDDTGIAGTEEEPPTVNTTFTPAPGATEKAVRYLTDAEIKSSPTDSPVRLIQAVADTISQPVFMSGAVDWAADYENVANSNDQIRFGWLGGAMEIWARTPLKQGLLNHGDDATSSGYILDAGLDEPLDSADMAGRDFVLTFLNSFSGAIASQTPTGTAAAGTAAYDIAVADAASNSGSGAGATFHVARAAGVYTVTFADDTAKGHGFAPADEIVILGTALGGLSPDNDLTVTVDTIGDVNLNFTGGDPANMLAVHCWFSRIPL